MPSVHLKKWACLGIAGKLQLGIRKLQQKPEASPASKREEHYSIEKKEAVGRDCFERKSTGGK